MSKYIVPILFIALITVGIIGLLSTKDQLAPLAGDVGIYCSADGMLTNKKPIQSHRSYCVKSNASTGEFQPNAAGEYAFSIVDDRGDVLKHFAITHTKPMHVIVVRDDLQHFQHLHPDFDGSTGEFTLSNLTFFEAGKYRIFADFAPATGMKDMHGQPLGVTIWEDVKVGGRSTPQPIGSEDRSKTFGKYQVDLVTNDPMLQAGVEETLSFVLKQDGEPVTDLEEYLGAFGHSVILREDTLDFIHAHPISFVRMHRADGAEGVEYPQNGQVDFMVTFPEAGKYKAFTQFQHHGEVFTTDFVISVGEGQVNEERASDGHDAMMH